MWILILVGVVVLVLLLGAAVVVPSLLQYLRLRKM